MKDKLPLHFEPEDFAEGRSVVFGSYGAKRGPSFDEQPPRDKTTYDEHLKRHQKLVDDYRRRVR
jgi:hypothetical protein